MNLDNIIDRGAVLRGAVNVISLAQLALEVMRINQAEHMPPVDEESFKTVCTQNVDLMTILQFCAEKGQFVIVVDAKDDVVRAMSTEEYTRRNPPKTDLDRFALESRRVAQMVDSLNAAISAATRLGLDVDIDVKDLVTIGRRAMPIVTSKTSIPLPR